MIIIRDVLLYQQQHWNWQDNSEKHKYNLKEFFYILLANDTLAIDVAM